MDTHQTNHSSAQQSEEPKVTPPDNKTVMGILSYIGPLVIIPFITSKNDPFVKFHIKQGLVLLVIEIATSLVGGALWILWPLLSLVNLAVLVLSIIGIVNVVHKQEKELPIVGSYASHFKI